MEDFPYVGGEGGGSTNIWKIPYVSSFLFLKASLIQVEHSLLVFAVQRLDTHMNVKIAQALINKLFEAKS